MASITKVAGGYRVRWRTPEGASRSKNFTKKWAADDYKTMIENSLLVGLYADPMLGKIIFRDYAEQWRLLQVHRPSTASQVETNFRRNVYPHIGDASMKSIRPSAIQSLVKHLSASLAPGTVELVYRYVSSVFKAAVDDRIISRTPCIGVKLPKAEKKLVTPLETVVVEAIIAAMPPRYQALIVLAAGTGLRGGECFGLTVDSVDFLRRTITVDRQLVLVKGSEPQFGPLKTEASYRTVPMPLIVQERLAAHLAQFGEGPDGLIFTNEKRLGIRRNRFADEWPAVREASGAPEGTSLHDMRHYYASLLIHRGLSVKAVQNCLGHSSAIETLDRYSHLWPDSEDETRDAIDAFLGTSKEAEATGS